MNIKFLGKWSSNLVRGERNTSFILEDKIVFDFGPHTLESLLDFGIDPNRIERVLITHLHMDHFSGIAELFWYRSIYNAKEPLKVYGPKGIKLNTERLLRIVKTPSSFNTKLIFIEDKRDDFVIPFRANHVVPNNGYRVTYNGKIIFYSGDTAYSKNVVKGAKNVDLLIHEMTYTDEEKDQARFWKHSTYSTVMKVFEESGAKRLIPVHLSAKSNLIALKISKERNDIIYPEQSIEF